MEKKLLLVVGTRPNFVKAAALIEAIKEEKGLTFELAHTGQHSDYEMSQAFFKELSLPTPDVNLNMRSTGYGDLGAMMESFSGYLSISKPDGVIVFGDVVSTLVCSLVAKYSNYPLAHVEAGCRSFDRTMPEEVNRVLVDNLSDYCFCNTEQDAFNLLKEGNSSQMFVVGNTMADTLMRNLLKVEQQSILVDNPYVLATFHRPSNVDDKENLSVILSQVKELSEKVLVVFPIHPRTRMRLQDFFNPTVLFWNGKLWFSEPFSYLTFLAYLRKAELVITDSGGVQVEAALLNTRCLTVRDSTEHPWTLGIGGNTLVKREDIFREAERKLEEPKTYPFHNELLDGNAAHRIVAVLTNGR